MCRHRRAMAVPSPASGRVAKERTVVMPTKPFRELLDKMPAHRQRRIATRVREILAAMPLEELRKARRMTQARLAETPGAKRGEVSKIAHPTDGHLCTLAGYIEVLRGETRW